MLNAEEQKIEEEDEGEDPNIENIMDEIVEAHRNESEPGSEEELPEQQPHDQEPIEVIPENNLNGNHQFIEIAEAGQEQIEEAPISDDSLDEQDLEEHGSNDPRCHTRITCASR